MIREEFRGYVLRLSRGDRAELVTILKKSLTEHKSRPANRYYQLLDLVAKLQGYDIIPDDSNIRDYVTARKVVAYTMLTEGVPIKEIAKQSGREYGTILRYIDVVRFALNHRATYGNMVELYERLKKKLHR